MILRYVVRFAITILITTVVSNSQVVAQTTTGTATGWVIAPSESAGEDISPGQNTTKVVSGAGAFSVPNTSSTASNNVRAETDFPGTRVFVDSTGLAAGDVAYAGAYFGDSVTFSGGIGTFELGLSWDFDGGISGSGGAYGISGGGIPSGPATGSAAANFRVFTSGFGNSLYNLDNTTLFKDIALEPGLSSFESGLHVPFFDPLEPEFSGGSSGPSTGNFLFDEYILDPETEELISTGGFVEGWYTDQNAGQLSGIGGGARFDWEYGVPLDIGVLLEGWAADGGVVDFWNTGTFTNFTVPVGTTYSASSGANYNLVSAAVPEPTSASVILFSGLALVCRRKRTLR